MRSSKVRVRSLPVRTEGDDPRRVVEERGELVLLHPHGPVYDPLYFDIRPGRGLWRGSHYHKTKTENFYIISGACRLRIVDLDTSEEETLDLREGDLVTVSPGCAHRMEALDFCRVVEFSLEEVDYARDTFPYDFPTS